MKKLIYGILAFILCSCQNEEMLSEKEVSGSNVPAEAQVASVGVSVEDGYLVARDFKALDSISGLVDQMSDMERMAWENQMGFESAYSHFNPYFKAFDALETEEEMIAYQEQHKTVVKVINDDECCDIDYPFQTRGRALVLSKDGKIKVGNALWIFKADRKITILDATKERIEKYQDAVNASDEEKVFVEYYDAIKARAGQADVYKVLKSGTDVDGKRKYNWSLDVFPEYSGNETRTILGLYQQGKRKRLAWKVYNTTYSCNVYILKTNNNPPPDSRLDKIQTSSEIRGGRYFYILRLYSIPQNFPSISEIGIMHSTRGCEGTRIVGAFDGSSDNSYKQELILSYSL